MTVLPQEGRGGWRPGEGASFPSASWGQRPRDRTALTAEAGAAAGNAEAPRREGRLPPSEQGLDCLFPKPLLPGIGVSSSCVISAFVRLFT